MRQNSNHINRTGALKHWRNQCDLFSVFREFQTHVDPGRRTKGFIFQKAEKEGAICSTTVRTLENVIYQNITNTVTTGRRTTYILGQTSQKLKCNIPGVATLITELHRSRGGVNNITGFENYSGEICHFFSLRSNDFPEELKEKACADTRGKCMQEGFCK